MDRDDATAPPPPAAGEPPATSGDPLATASRWLDEARASGVYANPTAMALATADAHGRPAVRMVLIKDLSTSRGYATFYTNYESRKGLELARNPRAAGVLYWEKLGRQLRLEGTALRSPAAESDAYFESRPLGSRINACVSEQSRSLADFAELAERMRAKRAELEATGAECVRPEHWGGYRLWLDRLEFWTTGEDRCHERVAFTRTLTPRGADAFAGGEWARMLLQP